MENIFSLLVAFIGLSFLIFIHELGHYLVAIKVGMKVEIFSIGFGKPIFSFHLNGVKWQIGCLPFGGFVRIAGMEKTGNIEPHLIKDGFYGSSPLKRILVASAGPVVNIAFALIVFSILYMLGGRIQNFSQHTSLIGYIDPKSEIAQANVKPGDQVHSIDGHKIQSFQDILYASVVDKKKIAVNGEKIDYFKKTAVPFEVQVDPYADSFASMKGLKTIGIKAPAQYLIYHPADVKMQKEPMLNSGLQTHDRIVWVNGELVFSIQHLSDVINENKVLLTIKRGDKIFQTKVPRIVIADLRLNQSQKEELQDYRHALSLKENINYLSFIPYDVDSKRVVQSAIGYIDEDALPSTVYNRKSNQFDSLLKKGDQILAVSGEKITSSLQMFELIQKKKALIIVQRGDADTLGSSNNEDQNFIDSFLPQQLSNLISAIGTDKQLKNSGQYFLLNPVQPMTYREMVLSSEDSNKVQSELEAKIKEAVQLKDLKQKNLYSRQLYEFNQKLLLGIPLLDRQVIYNPTPWQQTVDVFNQTKTTFIYLLSGQISPKWLAGPVGMIQLVHHSVMMGYKELLYWMALISLNLAIFNLLPLPILDGGHIVLSLYEKITGKLIPTKIKEMIMIPFMVLLVGLLVFVTFHDLSRIFSRFF